MWKFFSFLLILAFIHQTVGVLPSFITNPNHCGFLNGNENVCTDDEIFEDTEW